MEREIAAATSTLEELKDLGKELVRKEEELAQQLSILVEEVLAILEDDCRK